LALGEADTAFPLAVMNQKLNRSVEVEVIVGKLTALKYGVVLPAFRTIDKGAFTVRFVVVSLTHIRSNWAESGPLSAMLHST
jgi:hypothetical protein